MLDSILVAALLSATHIKQIYVLMPAQLVVYGILMGALALIFRRYHGQPFWLSLRWIPTNLSTFLVTGYGVITAFVVVAGSALIGTPDNDSLMKQLLSDPTSAIMLGIVGVTLAPLCEEIVFRGFLQPLLVRSLGAVPGILLAARRSASCTFRNTAIPGVTRC